MPASLALAWRNRSRSASGWVDKTAVEHSGVDGGPVQVRTTRKLDITGMSTEELDALERALTQTVLALEQGQIKDDSRRPKLPERIDFVVCV